MRKKLTLVCFLSLLFVISNAQRIGFKVGLSLTNAQFIYSGGPDHPFDSNLQTSGLAGIRTGLIGEVPISKNNYLNSGILFSQKGTEFSYSNGEVKFPINYLELPLNFTHKFGLEISKLYIQAGPYLGIGLSSKRKDSGDEEKISFGKRTDQIKRFDYGLNFAAGLEIKAIQFGINYGLGFPNLLNNNYELLMNGVLSISLGVLIGKGNHI